MIPPPQKDICAPGAEKNRAALTNLRFRDILKVRKEAFTMDNENVKKEWKKAGSDLGHAFAGLGKMLIRTAKVGMEKADEWANSDDSPKEEKKPEGQE